MPLVYVSVTTSSFTINVLLLTLLIVADDVEEVEVELKLDLNCDCDDGTNVVSELVFVDVLLVRFLFVVRVSPCSFSIIGCLKSENVVTIFFNQ